MAELSPYGSLVIGEAAFKEQEAARETAADIYGPLVVETHPAERLRRAVRTRVVQPDAGLQPDLKFTAAPGGKRPAEELAQKYGLGREAFDGVEPSGRGGAYTVADVEAIIRKECPGATLDGRPEASIDEVKAALAKNPAAVDDLFAAELARVEGPRRDALVLLKEAEGQRIGGPRNDVLAQIEAAF